MPALRAWEEGLLGQWVCSDAQKDAEQILTLFLERQGPGRNLPKPFSFSEIFFLGPFIEGFKAFFGNSKQRIKVLIKVLVRMLMLLEQ